MKKTIATLCGVAVIAFIGASGASAGDPHGSAPPVPGSPGCHGQTVAYLNAAFSDEGVATGLGNIAVAAGLTVQQVQQVVDTYCAS
jgi:hypothetical protein